MPIALITSPKIWCRDTRYSCIEVDFTITIGGRGEVSSSIRYEDRLGVDIRRLELTEQSRVHRGMADFVVGLLICRSGNR
jgi:hypothetical protein